MIIENSFEQGSPEWHKARMKSIGGTDIEKIITSKGNISKQREDYLYQKAGQILTGQSKQIFQIFEMQWGHTYEPIARDIFSFTKGIEMQTCAMMFHDDTRSWHISPDGYTDITGLEIKCPQLKAYHKYVSDHKLPTEYILQVQASLALTGFDWWWFMVYFPELKPMILKIERDERLIKIIKAEVTIFKEDLAELLTSLKEDR